MGLNRRKNVREVEGEKTRKKNGKTYEKNKGKKRKKQRKKITLKSAGVLYFGVGLLIISGKLAYFISGSILIQPEHYIVLRCFEMS